MNDICCKCGQPLGMVRISITGGVPGGWLHSDCAKFNVPDEIERLRARLAEATRLLDNWLQWAEHRHLTQDQFNDLVWDSQALCDADQPSAAPDLPALKKAVRRAERDLAGFGDAEDEFNKLRQTDKGTAP